MSSTEHRPAGAVSTGGTPARRRGPLLGAAAVLALVLVAALAWLFLAGPMSSGARDERDVADALEHLSDAQSFAEFNDRLCEQYRAPKELVDGIASTGAQTGTDVDTMFRESVLSKFPKDLEVTDVTVDGDEATATARSSADGQERTEEVLMRREDDRWTVCQPGVGMGAVPPTGGN